MIAATTSAAGVDARLLGGIGTARRIGAPERLDAYRANIRGAHLQALDLAYPVTREVLGPRYWQQLLEGALPRFASASPDLNAYGEFLPALLGEAQKRRVELSEMPYLEELADLEWTVHRVGFARDDRRFDWDGFAELTAVGQSPPRLLRSSALSIMRLRYPVDDIWRAHAVAAEHESRGTGICCVHRDARFGVTVSPLERDDHALLEVLPESGIEHLLDDRDEAESARLTRKVFRWIERGWIVGFETG